MSRILQLRPRHPKQQPHMRFTVRGKFFVAGGKPLEVTDDLAEDLLAREAADGKPLFLDVTPEPTAKAAPAAPAIKLPDEPEDDASGEDDADGQDEDPGTPDKPTTGTRKKKGRGK